MAVDFNSDTWKYVEAKLKEGLENQKAILTNYDSSFKDLLRAQGHSAALKTLLEMPQTAQLIAATKSRT